MPALFSSSCGKNGFVSMFAADFEKRLFGLDKRLKSKEGILGSDFLLNSSSETKTNLEVKRKVVADVLRKTVCTAEDHKR